MSTVTSPTAAAPGSIRVDHQPAVEYLLRLGDTCLVLGQRLGEWCGHAPVLEEDIALANMALDLIGQTRALLTHAGQLEGAGHDEDQLAFLRDERDYRNLTMVELPNGPGKPGDFAFTVLRNLFVSTWLKAHWAGLQGSTDSELAGIAGKALKEARYHQQHAADWVLRLAGGTDESRRRTEAALDGLWRYCAEMFVDDATDAADVVSAGLGPTRASLQAGWRSEVGAVLAAAGLTPPADSPFRSQGTRGVHTEHMGGLLAELQYLQRAYPGGAW